jgi:raffinose/stachyose/melibiose transport system substrate-binding protein
MPLEMAPRPGDRPRGAFSHSVRQPSRHSIEEVDIVSSRLRILSIAAVAVLLVGACTGSGASPSGAAPTEAPATGATSAPPSEAAAPVEIDWYHIQNNDPGLSLWQALADEYMTAHPNVKVNVNVLENEAFKTKLGTELAGGNVPDLFQSWGGGGMAEQVDAGLLKDITADIESWKADINPGALGLYAKDGKQYGVPFDLGMVGFWYNKDQFAQAGITAPPTTWEELLTDVQKLKDAGITPIALGGKDKWPGMFWWAYLALRSGGAEAMQNAVATGDWSGPAFIEAGTQLKRLVDMEPFQEGFLAAPWDGAGGQAATMATGKAAMQLMGQWAPGTMNANSPDGLGLGDKLGWFAFPALDGGAGDITDAFGGGNGFVVGKDAPAETVDFLKFLTSLDAANRWGATNSGILPTTVGAEGFRHRPEHDVGAGESSQGAVRPALPRPGHDAGTRWCHQRRHPDDLRRDRHTRRGRQDHHDRGPVRQLRRLVMTPERAGATPARSLPCS